MEEVKPFHRDVLNYSDSTTNAMPLRLNSVHRKIMRLDIAGWSAKDISVQVGMTEARISVVKSSGLYKVERDRMQKEIDGLFSEKEVEATEDPVKKIFKDEALASAEKLVELRDDAKMETVKQKSALEILDRAGYKAPKDEVLDTGAIEVESGLANAIRQAMVVMKQSVEVTVNVGSTSKDGKAGQGGSESSSRLG